MATLLHLERNTELLLKLMQHFDCPVSEEESLAIAAEKQLAKQLIGEEFQEEHRTRPLS